MRRKGDKIGAHTPWKKIVAAQSNALLAARLDRRLTQAQAAKLCGVSLRTYVAIENQKNGANSWVTLESLVPYVTGERSI